MLEQLVNLNLINVNLKSKNKIDIFEELASPLIKDKRISDLSSFIKEIKVRESQGVTSMEGIAYPHCKSSTVIQPAISIGIAPDGVEYEQDADEPAPRVFFMIASPEDSNYHIEVLKVLFTKFNPKFVDQLCSAKTPQDVLTIIKKD